MPSPRSRIAPYFSGRLRMFRISCVCLQADGSTASRSNHSLHRPVHTQVLQDPQRISFLRLDPLSTISRQGLPQQYPTSPDQEEEVGSPRRRQIQKSNDLRSRCATVLQKFRMLQSPPRPLAPPRRRKPQLCVLVWISPRRSRDTLAPEFSPNTHSSHSTSPSHMKTFSIPHVQRLLQPALHGAPLVLVARTRIRL